MPIDFLALLSPRTKYLLGCHAERVEEFRALSDGELARTAEYYMKNTAGGRLGVEFEKGEPVYDATMVDVVIPELIARIRARSGGPRGEGG